MMKSSSMIADKLNLSRPWLEAFENEFPMVSILLPFIIYGNQTNYSKGVSHY